MKILGLSPIGLSLMGILAVASCQTTPKPPPPSDVKSAPELRATEASAQSKAAASIAAAEIANQENPDGNPKEAVKGELGVAAASLPKPTDKDLAEALTRVTIALSGDLTEARAQWRAATDAAGVLRERVGVLERQVENERVAAKAELERQLKEARDAAQRQAEARERFWMTIFFFGGGALFIVAAGASMYFASVVPALGPKVTMCLGLTGGALIVTGIIIRAINRFIENHPYMFWGTIVAAIIAAAIALGLMISNHLHGKEAKQIAALDGKPVAP